MGAVDHLDELVEFTVFMFGIFHVDQTRSSCNTQQCETEENSPADCKPADFLGFDEHHLHQHSPYRYISPETVAQYKQYDTGDTVSTIVSATTKGVAMKRTFTAVSTHSPTTIHKRRMYDETGAFNGAAADGAMMQAFAMSATPMHQNCINELSDPSLG